MTDTQLRSLRLGSAAVPMWRTTFCDALRRATPLGALEGPAGCVVEAAAWSLDGLRDVLHPYFEVPWSSQAFAVNLFAPLTRTDVASLLTTWFGLIAVAEDPNLEWVDPNDHLREVTSPRPHKTQVDVMLRGITKDRRRVAALIEVKLTESDFSGCSACDDAPLYTIEPCMSDGPFGNAPDQCWQLRNRDRGPSRRYQELLTIEGPPTHLAGCWFRGGLNQVMRLCSLANALVDTGELDACKVVICAPTDNRPVQRTLAQAERVFGDVVQRLPPEEVLPLHRPAVAAHLAARFGLDPPARPPDPPVTRGWKIATALTIAEKLVERRPDLSVDLDMYPAGDPMVVLTNSATDAQVLLPFGLGIYLHRPGDQRRSDYWWDLAEGRTDQVIDLLERHLGSCANPPRTKHPDLPGLAVGARLAHVANAFDVEFTLLHHQPKWTWIYDAHEISLQYRDDSLTVRVDELPRFSVATPSEAATQILETIWRRPSA
jgi:hypothetical protein